MPYPPAFLWKRDSGHEEAFLWIPAFAGMTRVRGRYADYEARYDEVGDVGMTT